MQTTSAFTRAPFATAFARADHWGLAAKQCQEDLGGQPANVGFLYVTEAFNQDLSSILTFLRETTHIPHWTGAVAPAILAGGHTAAGEGALAVMTGLLPEGSFHSFNGVDAAEICNHLAPWLKRNQPCTGLAYGDPRSRGMPGLIGGLAQQAGFLVGGLVSPSGPPALLADTVVASGVAGLMLGHQVTLISGLTQGCSPLGAPHRVTQAADGVLIELDGQPALEVLKAEAGQLIARDLRRAAGYIHVALPVTGSDLGDYQVRMMLGMDPRQGWLAVGDTVEVGSPVMFVRRDPQTARADLDRMLTDVIRRVDGRPVRAAFYHSCIGRGRNMFGSDEAELAMVRRVLGDVPLVGLFGNGEFSGERFYTFTGVLSLVLGEGA